MSAKERAQLAEAADLLKRSANLLMDIPGGCSPIRKQIKEWLSEYAKENNEN